MGTDGHVIVVGPCGEQHVSQAMQRIASMERLWTRFDPASELSRLGRAEGRPVTVTAETYALVERMVLAWQATDGRFDPTVADRMVDLGYDRPFVELHTVSGSALSTGPPDNDGPVVAAPGCASIQLDGATRSVTVPAGVTLDPGGIGKGLAADLVSAELADAGAWGVLVNLGGDLRVRGIPPAGDAWTVDIAEPELGDEVVATVRLVDCGLATSTTLRRRWTSGGRRHHHIIDPVTGQPSVAGADLTSVVAGDAWWAEAAATAWIGDGAPLEGCAGIRVLADGTVERHHGFEGYEA